MKTTFLLSHQGACAPLHPLNTFAVKNISVCQTGIPFRNGTVPFRNGNGSHSLPRADELWPHDKEHNATVEVPV